VGIRSRRMAGIENGDAKMILTPPGIFVKEELSRNGTPYTKLEYKCEEVGRIYNRERYDELFVMKDGIAVDRLVAFSLKDAVWHMRRHLGLKDGRSCMR
jgi:hypothetical protein